MCGIAGFIDFNNSSSEAILKECTDTMLHRGPDGSGYEFFQNANCQVGLGHRRLAIIDLTEAGKQPMQYRQWHIIFNGEMYNYAEVKIELEDLGHHFISHSDTEVVLHAWEQWGSEMIHRFIGMFAFVIYDAEKKSVVCFRDRAGVKPFYYYWKDGLLLFASELKAFHKHPGFRKEINPAALHLFLQYGYILAPLSIFKNAHKLLPGHFFTLDTGKPTGTSYPEPGIVKYWDVYDAYNKPKLDISEEEAIIAAEQLLISACKYRLVADVPVGVFLSGGYDSSAVTALLQSNQTEKLRTYTIGFHEEDHNEAVYAKAVAKHLGTEHTEYYCTTKEAQDIIPDIPFYCDEPFGDSSIIPTTLVSRLARKEVTVALSADAGDETFAGYSKYPAALNYLKKIHKVPSFLRSTSGSILNTVPDVLLNSIAGNTAAGLKKERFASILKDKNISAAGLMDRLLSQVYTSRQLVKLLTDPGTKTKTFFQSQQELDPLMPELDKMLAMDYKTYMVDDILVKVDRAAMSTSLEGREPLLDHRLVELAAQLPAHFKMNGHEKKYLLKKITHKYLPKEMMDRPKMGFGVPVFKWLKTDLKYYVDEYMNDGAFLEHGLFIKEEVDHIKKRFFAGDRNYNSLFWYLLMFQMWYKQWM